jgi:hypothetical protein
VAIFGVLEVESTVQVNDKTRLNASKSFISKDEDPVTLVEIEPEAAAGFIDVTGASSKDWFLDWVYVGASRNVTVSLRITAGTVQTFTKTLAVTTAVDDNLFSSDQDLIAYEPDILKWVPQGRASYLNVHREAQARILEWLDEAGLTDRDGNRLTKAALVDVQEVRAWSRDLTLSLIFKGIQNAVDDVFAGKAQHYASEAVKRSDRTRLRLDLNGDDTISRNESVFMNTRELLRQ